MRALPGAGRTVTHSAHPDYALTLALSQGRGDDYVASTSAASRPMRSRKSASVRCCSRSRSASART